MEETQELYEFMKGFRETFCRPIRRIRFVGLFDTVNSVPQFETAWLGRSAFPFTAKTSAKFIRHAVSIDERRAKFRVDLISAAPDEDPEKSKKRPQYHRYLSDLPAICEPKEDEVQESSKSWNPFARKISQKKDKVVSSNEPAENEIRSTPGDTAASLTAQENENSLTQEPPRANPYSSQEAVITVQSDHRVKVPKTRQDLRHRLSDLRDPQDILEVWFAGNHGDIGGGWEKDKRETWPCAHQALVWMVHEAQKAGLVFDEEKLVALNCSPTKLDVNGQPDKQHENRFSDALHASATTGIVHDCLRYHHGLNAVQVLGWQILEHLPFKRMDLQPDGRWKTIRSPLPLGEVRDIPRDAKIHHSVIERMEYDKNYRPGNLIMLGVGGRGQRIAPKELGMGEWVTLEHPGDQVNEIMVSKKWAETGSKPEAPGLKEKVLGWMPKALVGNQMGNDKGKGSDIEAVART